MTDTYRVIEGTKYHEFDKATIDKMRDLGLIRFYGTIRFMEGVRYNYHPAPRSRKVSGRKW